MANQDSISEIKKGLEEKKLLIGRERVLQSLKLGKLHKVYTSSSCPKGMFLDVSKYARLAGTEHVVLEFPSPELGVICKRQFFISVVGLSK